jgi:hypothetical protein
MTSNERVLDKPKDALGAKCMRHLHTGLDSGCFGPGVEGGGGHGIAWVHGAYRAVFVPASI